MNTLNVLLYSGTMPPKMPPLAKKHGDGCYVIFIRAENGYSCITLILKDGKKQITKELPYNTLVSYLITLNNLISKGLKVKAVIFPEKYSLSLNKVLRNNRAEFKPQLSVVSQFIDK